MPVGISSAARNLFLLGSSGADVVTNFFQAVDQSASGDDQFVAKAIKYSEYDERYILGLQAEDGNSKKHALVEKRATNGFLEWNFEIESLESSDTILTDIHLDVNGKLIVAGSSGTVPFIARYTNNGAIEWSSTTNSANVRYNGIASDSSGQYYACGNTDESGSAQAFIEKYGADGTPGWGKSAINIGSDIVLHAIDTNNRGEVVAGGYLEDTNAEFKGYFVKLDSATGEVLWDRTLEITDRDWGSVPVTEINDVMIDGNDFIYIVGSQFAGVSGDSAGFICKYTPEGNMLWQKETPVGAANSGRWRYNCVEADTATGQIIILGSYFENTSDEYGVLVKYSDSGNRLFTRVIESTETTPPEFGTLTTPRGGMALDADPSFYYILFTDQDTDPANTIPDKYTFGKVSSSGNGLGAFSYTTGDANTIEYYIQNIGDRIGRLSDGSVRNDTSDLATNILNPTKIMFDDLATQVTNKKRQMNRADDFEYSGSPAIRPTDFQELNLLGDTGFTPEPASPVYSLDLYSSNGWGDNTQPHKGFDGNLTTTMQVSSVGTPANATWTPTGYTIDTKDEIYVYGTSSNETLVVSGSLGSQNISPGTVDGVTNVFTVPTNLGRVEYIRIINPGGVPGWKAIKVGGKFLVDGAGEWKDQSGKGNNGRTVVTEQVKEPLPGFGSVKFDGGVNSYLSIPDSQLLEILDEDFTVEFWIYVTGTRSQQCIFSKSRNVQCYWDDNNTIALYLDDDGSGATGTNGYGVFFNSNLTGTDSVMKHQWHHVAICRDNNTWKAFVDGVQKYSNVIPGLNPVINTSDDFEIGSFADNRGQGSLANEFQGYISNFRWVKGEALYLSNFTVPSTPLTPAGGSPVGVLTSLLTCQGDTIKDARTGTPNVITSNGGVAPSQFRYGPTYNSSGWWEFDGVDDGIKVPRTHLYQTGDEISVEAWINAGNINQQTYQAFFTIGGTSGTLRDRMFQMRVSDYFGSDGYIDVLYRNSANDAWQILRTTFPAISLNDYWYHVVSTYTYGTGSSWKIYVNGDERSTTFHTGDGNADPIQPVDPSIYIGLGEDGRPTYGDDSGTVLEQWLGKIGEVRLYHRTLSPEQIFQNYNATKSKYLNEAPNTAPKIGPGIVYDNDLLLHYDFGNRACYDSFANRFDTPDASSNETIITPSDSGGLLGDQNKGVAIGYGKIVAGAPNHAAGGVSNTGAAYIYDIDGTNEIKLVASDAASNNFFGKSVAITSSKIYIGARNTSNGGAVYSYDHDGTNELKITASDSVAGDAFGWSVATNGSKLVVGAPFSNGGRGAVYTFDLDGSNQSKITTDPNIDALGISVDINSTKIVAGATQDNANTGAMYVYDIDGTNQLKITASDGATSDQFGRVVAMTETKIIAGVYIEDSDGLENNGAAYIYNLDGSGEIKLLADDKASHDQYGISVAAGLDKFAVGSWADDDNGDGSGSVYLYDNNGNFLQKFIASNGAASDFFGSSVALGEDKLVVAAKGAGTGGVLYTYGFKFPLPTTVKNLKYFSQSPSVNFEGTIDGATFNSDGYFVFDNANNDEIITNQITPADTPRSGLTVEVWANLSSSTVFGSGGQAWMIGEEGRWRMTYDDAFTDGGFYFACATSNNSWFTNGTSIFNYAPSYMFNDWHHFVGVYDGSNLRMYYDGGAGNVNATTISGDVNTGGNPLMSIMGTDAANVGWGTGSIGQVRVYGRGLTATEILQNYNATRGKYGV